MKHVNELTEADFEKEVLPAAIPVVVDFYAPGCGRCKMMAPLLERHGPAHPQSNHQHPLRRGARRAARHQFPLTPPSQKRL